MISLHDHIDWKKGDGLVPAIVQHAVTGRVLMLGYMNADALTVTQSSELVTFYSRSRNCLWTKGETSGNKLKLRDIELDCDGDALLVTADPTGPTCHLEKSSCFDHDAELPGFGCVGQLETIIEDRMRRQPSESYTAQLVTAGVQRIA
ncbi:MAG: phosphoribosyl-AMP cyclohydrolase, partial [Proteobacteria bacterium]|nr:phosphoribosyl-AMP cyclohydrolase [Pseudomonadota bacterium]